MTIALDNFVQEPDVKLQQHLTCLQQAMRILLEVDQEQHFKAATISFCNVMASTWKCERVSLGFVHRHDVQLETTSYTDTFDRKTQLIQMIESAMEECADQDEPISYPTDSQKTFINHAAQSLSKRHEQQSILSLPLHKNESLQGVVTLQRSEPFTHEEAESIRLACQLCAGRLIDLYERHHWLTSLVKKKREALVQSLAAPQHSRIKIGVVGVFLLLLFIFFGKGTNKIEAPFTLEATYQQVIPAPFDGYIKSVHVEVGDPVESQETVLATLDTAELRMELAEVMAEQEGYHKQYAGAMRDKEIAQAQIAKANSEKAQAQIHLLNYRMNQAQLISPIQGTVVKGDLKRQIGAPVKTGDALFEVTPLESLRAELQVPEEEILDIEIGQTGSLAIYSYPSQHITFKVEQIHPVAEVMNKRNIFKVRVKLLSASPWMRPGMEGVAKIHAAPKSYMGIWTRKATNWIRMKLWI